MEVLLYIATVIVLSMSRNKFENDLSPYTIENTDCPSSRLVLYNYNDRKIFLDILVINYDLFVCFVWF
jgi:hypothetical protein